MRDINYDNYFWQNELVRLRAMEESDWEDHYYNRFDTPARRVLNYEVELPPTVTEAKDLTPALLSSSLAPEGSCLPLPPLMDKALAASTSIPLMRKWYIQRRYADRSRPPG